MGLEAMYSHVYPLVCFKLGTRNKEWLVLDSVFSTLSIQHMISTRNLAVRSGPTTYRSLG